MLITPSKRRTASDSHPRPATLAALHALHAPQSDTSRSHSYSDSHPRSPHSYSHSQPAWHSHSHPQDAPTAARHSSPAHDTAPPPSAASSPPATLLCTPGDDCACVWEDAEGGDAEAAAAKSQQQQQQQQQPQPQPNVQALQLRLHLHPPSCSDSESDPHAGPALSPVDLASRIEAWRVALAPPEPTALKRNKAYVSLRALADADADGTPVVITALSSPAASVCDA